MRIESCEGLAQPLESRMYRVLAALACAVSPALFFLLPSFQSAPPPGQCPNLVRLEPVLIYSSTGATVLGTEDVSLVVYNNGNARWTRFFSTFEVPGATSEVRLSFAGEDAVRDLVLDLSVLGAGTECDEDLSLVDVSAIRTLTLLRDQTDTRGHTLNWGSGAAPYGALQARIDAFVQSTFPE